jgi:mannose-6-phosphate isomerase-like protein (cupin superfamily)
MAGLVPAIHPFPASTKTRLPGTNDIDFADAAGLRSLCFISFRRGDPHGAIGISPPDNGTKLRVVEFPPLDAATEAKMEPEFLLKSVGDHAPVRGLPVTHPLMHRTRTVDYAVVLSGEIDMMLDDQVVHLKPGDVAVQQATNHAWINRGTQPCRILFVLMDARQP